MILELAVVAQLAARCAPAIAFETLAAVVRTESGFQPFVLGVNGPGGGAVLAETREAAAALATDLIVRQGRSVDLGLMQVNSGNLRALGLTVAEVLDPCTNLAAGARILREGYTTASRGEPDPQRALRVAFSRYNTGHPERGFANGYVRRVQGAAEVVVPAIRLRGEVAAVPPRSAVAPIPELPDDDPDAPPEWDVWARATHASRPRLMAVPRETPAASGGAVGSTPTDPPRTAE
ncbi:conjugal transfer protein [Roseomonas sp. KE2513]|uniref:lytic transglycosylase domain-containing protein n=1 Tax=Roseomonas sp. KE2513 TaxID=2479202 RepID=UPI0018DF0754|nr:lytic transglycosylase domain-containing protein [Roseomonas sp. KE2513]MBI0539095.1 conjugal transfer protein [Roseomonas sp. KE2513]